MPHRHRAHTHDTTTTSSVTDFLPFQVEVGCGVSYEAGIPLLHRLHEMYHVNEIEDEQLRKGFTFVLCTPSCAAQRSHHRLRLASLY